MDLCHHKNCELEKKFQKYKGRVVLRGDTAKDASGKKLRCIHGARCFIVTYDGGKSLGRYFKITLLF